MNQQRIIGQFMELVRIDSETKHEEEISAYLKQAFAANGLHVFEDATAAITGHGSGNLFFTWDATSGLEHLPTLLFTCHMDTVAPGNGIQPQLDSDGYIRSNGTTILGSDDKAGISALMEAVQVIQEEHRPHGPIQFVITAGEESGLVGARAMDPKHLHAKYGYAMDSNGNIGEIAVAAPTQSKIQITFWGKSAHAGVNPEDGISAIQVASKAVSRMRLGRIDKDTTANIGRFEGGGATNIVCERVDLHAEARSLYMDKLDLQVNAMREASEAAAEEMGAKVDFESTIIYPSYSFNEKDAVVQLATRALNHIGKTAKLFQSGGGSDANVFNGLGVPTVNLAIGYEHIHTVKEQIKISDLVASAELVLAIIDEASKTS